MEKESGTIIEEEATMEENLIVRGIAFEDKITQCHSGWFAAFT